MHKHVMKLIFVLGIITVLLMGCKSQAKVSQVEKQDGKVTVQMPKKGEEIAVITTNMGTIKIRLFPDIAPKAVENFTTHAKDGYYDGVIFHRVIPDFMIQGGDPEGTGTGGESIWGDPFEDEFSEDLHNYRGALSMANIGQPNTNGSQFFIVQKKEVEQQLLDQMKQVGFSDEVIENYKQLGGTPWLDNHHTVFGQVFEGMGVVDAITAVETGDQNKPVEDVVMEKVEIQKYEE